MGVRWQHKAPTNWSISFLVCKPLMLLRPPCIWGLHPSTVGGWNTLLLLHHLISFEYPFPRGPALSLWCQGPQVPSPFWPTASKTLGICFLAARGYTLIHLYHRKQKTSLTSHLFHRWESNSLLNDCPEPTIQRGGIYCAAEDQGALLSCRYTRELEPFFLSLLLAWREKPLNMIKVKRLLKLQTAAIQLFCSIKCNADWSYFSEMCF